MQRGHHTCLSTVAFVGTSPHMAYRGPSDEAQIHKLRYLWITDKVEGVEVVTSLELRHSSFCATKLPLLTLIFDDESH